MGFSVKPLGETEDALVLDFAATKIHFKEQHGNLGAEGMAKILIESLEALHEERMRGNAEWN